MAYEKQIPLIKAFSSGAMEKKTMYVIFAAVAIFMVATAVGIIAGFVQVGRDNPQSYPSNTEEISATQRIKELCKPTEFKGTCESAIQHESENITNPQELITASFKIAIKELRIAAENSNNILAEMENNTYNKKAVDGCKELAEASIDELQNCIKKFDSLDVSKLRQHVEDIKTSLSAVITYHETCFDSFAGGESEAGEKMKQPMEKSEEIAMNALALVVNVTNAAKNKLKDVDINGIVSSRRLLDNEHEEQFPWWVTVAKRRLLQAEPETVVPNVVVAKDGSGKYTRINESLVEIPVNNPALFVIYVKEGVYDEQVILTPLMTNVMIMGDGPTNTRVVAGANFVDGTPTHATATFAVKGTNTIVKDMGFENIAGPEKHQAVAFSSRADCSVIYNCRFDGFQDTLFTHANRQFYRDCTITGTVDFTFGNAPAFFQNCTFVIRKPLPKQDCMVTAQGRLQPDENTGFVLHNCRITGDPEYLPVKDLNKAYLARPWKEFSRTVILYSQIEDVIQPEGYLPWDGDMFLDTIFYTEFGNKGPGSDTAARVKWNGIKTIDAAQAAQFSPQAFFRDDLWIKQSKVPYDHGSPAPAAAPEM